MKGTFRGYYRPTDDEFKELWDNCLFIFDTNVLLHVYRYSKQTSDELLSMMDSLSDRLWIPHQVALEYQKSRPNIILQQEKAYDQINDTLKDAVNKLTDNLTKRFEMHKSIDVKELCNQIKDNIEKVNKVIDGLKVSHPKLLSDDYLRERITKIFDGKVGESYAGERLENIYKIGEKRYRLKIPPGFKDEQKEGIDKYGDLVLWFQIIDKAKNKQKPIIFVTDENKEDWWWKPERNTTISPRPELIEEMYSETKQAFYMYRPEKFMEYIGRYGTHSVDSKAISEVEEFRKLDLEVGRIESQRSHYLNLLRKWIKLEREFDILDLFSILHPADIADIIDNLKKEEKIHLFALLDIDKASDVILEMSDVSREQILEGHFRRKNLFQNEG